MFRTLIRAVFDDARRGDDRVRVAGDGSDPAGTMPSASVPAAGAGTDVSLAGKPPILRRRTIHLIAIVGIAVIAYGTVAPFEIDRGRSLSWGLGWHPPAPGDTVFNVLLYIPIGAFLRLLFRRRGSSREREWLLSILAAGWLSYLTEVVQTFVPARVPSSMDTVCNFSGAMIGIALGPLLQRGLRNLHAFVYVKLRTEPLAAAAAATLVCVCAYALAPPDLHPAPGHVAGAVQKLRVMPESWLWLPGSGDEANLSPVELMDKMVAAGSYGFLALVLVLSGRESGRRPVGSACYAFSRSFALAAVIEAIQLFTVSHAADLRDLASACVCCGLGSGVGGLLVCRRRRLHERPAAVLRGLVVVVALTLLAWSAGSVLLEDPSPSPAPELISWVPMLDNFDRSWNGLLGDYTTGLLQYGLLAGLAVLWYRSHRQAPRANPIVALVLGSALLAGAVAAYRGHGFDSAQLLLALLAGVMALRLDRAIFGKKAAALPAL